MKKIFLRNKQSITSVAVLLLIVVTLAGCVKEFDNVVEVNQVNYRVIYVGVDDSIKYVPGDSVAFVRLGLTNPSIIKSVYVNIYSSENKKLNSNPVYLSDNGDVATGDYIKGDSIYSAKFPFSQYYPSGNYRAEYFVEDKYSNSAKIAVKLFTFDNAQSNIPPVVANLSAPDTAFIGQQTTVIKLTVDATDSNGISDIELVYFNSFIPPNGNPSSSNPFKMYDDGTNGDDVAGDGKFTLLVQLPATGVTKGVYRWEFQARDRGKKLSNVIVHNIHIL
ncbi:MAG: choice-of-anchor X domain-containing protein [Ignavibacteriaceae bacterium]